jgi:hypothetical protein
MTCSDVERVLPEFLDDAPDGALPGEVEAHVKSCPACSDLVSDLKLIASEARQLAVSDEPAPRVWVRIAGELRAEGLIRDPESAPVRPILVPTSRRRWSAWWLAPVAAAILAAGAYVVSHKPAPQVAKQQTPATSVAAPAAVAAAVTPAPVPAPTPQQLAQKSAKPEFAKPDSAKSAGAGRSEVGPAPSAEDQQFLSAVSTLTPSMRTTYELQLQAVNADIQETQAYVDRNPGDMDARQHLMDAYQQKALLYQIALDRIQ